MVRVLVVSLCVSVLAVVVVGQLSNDDLAQQLGGVENVQRILHAQLNMAENTPDSLRRCIVNRPVTAGSEPLTCGKFINHLRRGIHELTFSGFRCGRCHDLTRVVRNEIITYMQTNNTVCHKLLNDLGITAKEPCDDKQFIVNN